MNGELCTHISDLIGRWRQEGLPGHDLLTANAADLNKIRTSKGTRPLWSHPPLLLTATLDDALGQGLAVIHRFAESAGLRTRHLGLAVSAQTVIDASNEMHPELLGMTVLQFDSEEDLIQIRQEIPTTTRMVCGGPIFKADPDLAGRCGIDYVASDVGAFLQYLLDHRAALSVNDQI